MGNPRRDEQESASQSSPLGKTLRQVVSLMIIAALIWAVYAQRHTLASALVETPSWVLGLIAGATLLGWVINTATQYVVLRVLGEPTSFSLLLALHIAGGLINHLPARVGTVYRAHYLKRRKGLRYMRFGSLIVTNTVLYLCATAALATLALVVEYGLRQPAAMLGILLAGLALSNLLLLVCPLPAWITRFRLGRKLRDLVNGRDLIVGRLRVLALLLLAHSALFLLAALRMSGAFLAIDADLPFAGSMVLGAVKMLSLVVSFTPAGLGIQEFLVAATSTLVGTAFTAGFTAAAVIRGVALALYIILGLPSIGWLKLRN